MTDRRPSGTSHHLRKPIQMCFSPRLQRGFDEKGTRELNYHCPFLTCSTANAVLYGSLGPAESDYV